MTISVALSLSLSVSDYLFASRLSHFSLEFFVGCDFSPFSPRSCSLHSLLLLACLVCSLFDFSHGLSNFDASHSTIAADGEQGTKSRKTCSDKTRITKLKRHSTQKSRFIEGGYRYIAAVQTRYGLACEGESTSSVQVASDFIGCHSVQR